MKVNVSDNQQLWPTVIETVKVAAKVTGTWTVTVTLAETLTVTINDR